MGANERWPDNGTVCVCVWESAYGNDIAVKSDPQSPLPPAYWVVCFAEWLSEVGVIEISPDGQLDTLGNASQYISGWSVCGPIERCPETEKRAKASAGSSPKTQEEKEYPAHR